MDDTSREIDELAVIEAMLNNPQEKSLTAWFKEKWVDISRPKPGGGFEECGRADADSGKYPKCVPASKASKMTQEEIDSAVRRKRRAESGEERIDKKPINVSTDKKDLIEEKSAIPTDSELYERVKAEAKAKFDVYPSAYANAWLVSEYKKRGGSYRKGTKSMYDGENLDKPKWMTSGIRITIESEDRDETFLVPEEKELATALVSIAKKYGKFNQDGTGIWAGYDSAKDNDVAKIGVKCSNCALYAGGNQCRIIALPVEPNGKCRFAVIPDGIVSK